MHIETSQMMNPSNCQYNIHVRLTYNDFKYQKHDIFTKID